MLPGAHAGQGRLRVRGGKRARHTLPYQVTPACLTMHFLPELKSIEHVS